MLKSARVGGFCVCCEDESCGTDFLRLFSELAAEIFPTETALGNAEKPAENFVKTELAGSTTGRVFKISVGGKNYVFKQDTRRNHALDHRLQSFIFGSNSLRLIRSLERVGGAEIFPAAKVFLVADRKRFGAVTESFLITEYIEGENLGSVPNFRERYGAEVAAVIAKLHANGLVHGDVHERNFILGAAGTRYAGKVVGIDLSGKRSTKYTRAEDRIRLEWVFGVPNERRDAGTTLFLLKGRLRNFLRRIRGCKPINEQLLRPHAKISSAK